MKRIFVILIFLIVKINCFGQDGSDIKYVPVKEIDSSFVGKFAHLDFYRRSFHLRPKDTVNIVIDKKPIRFEEHRSDDGYNNWFSKQYLLSLDKIDNNIIKIVKCKIAGVTADSILVINYLEYYNADQSKVKRSRQLPYWFRRKDIIEVLVKSDED